MPFTMMPTATTVLSGSLLLLARPAGRCSGRPPGGGFQPAVVDYHRSCRECFLFIMSKCLKCQSRQRSQQRHVACSITTHQHEDAEQ